jgi:transcriptional regulator with XRE-family HTH domain
MSIPSQVQLRTRKLGVLIRGARLNTRKTMEECAEAIGVTRGVFRAYEEGRRAPSLPELEILIHFLNLSIDYFWGKDTLAGQDEDLELQDPTRLSAVRQRLIGVLLRQDRLNAGLSMKDLAERAGIPQSRLKAYELGQRPIPVPELEGLLEVLGGQVENYFDKNSPVGRWIAQREAVEQFLKLPTELQDFVAKPINLPYIELARKLSDLSRERLRSVAEDLLEITL